MTRMPSSRACARPVLALLLLLPLAACGGEQPTPAGERPVLADADNPDVADGVDDSETPRIVSIVMTDGELTGDTGVVQIPRNARVRLVVISDETDTLLVQGYELQALATAEVPVQLEFIAAEAGDFRVVLRGSDRTLTTLRIA